MSFNIGAKRVAELALAIDPARFRDMPIINNEADMRVGFNIPYQARMDERFAAWLAALMIASKLSDSNGRVRDAASAPNMQAEITLLFAIATASMSKAMMRFAAMPAASLTALGSAMKK